MKKIIIFIFAAFALKTIAGDNLQVNTKKLELKEKSFLHLDSLLQSDQQKKSVLMAAIYSAILPGAGEYYAESYWKAALFATLEIAGWTANIIYNAKGDKQDDRMRAFGDKHWSEKRYWEKIYYDAVIEGKITADPLIYDEANHQFIVYNSDIVNSIRYLEVELNHTHRLPETKTQQYYEMIYKYLTQFGNGWDDADFFLTYDGVTNTLTPHMFRYRDLRNEMNDLYDIASTAANAILINHVLSALDAAWTTNNYNRRVEMHFGVQNLDYFDERVQMYGVTFTW